MINDRETNKVYIAEGLTAYTTVCMNLLIAFRENGINADYLPLSKSPKHIWARDYMPIQTGAGEFLQYTYKPDYLRDDPSYIPKYRAIAKRLGLQCRRTRLIIDGGNVVKCWDKVIMTDKVFDENAPIPKCMIISELHRYLGADVVLIPWDRYEPYGHADGMVRYIGKGTVLLNNYRDFDRGLRKKLIEDLKPYFGIEELHYDSPRCSKMSWAYLNFLQTEKHIFVPGLGIKEDYLALEQIQGFYPKHKIVLIPGCQDLVRDGGALNCISWTIFEDEDDLPY